MARETTTRLRIHCDAECATRLGPPQFRLRLKPHLGGVHRGATLRPPPCRPPSMADSTVPLILKIQLNQHNSAAALSPVSSEDPVRAPLHLAAAAGTGHARQLDGQQTCRLMGVDAGTTCRDRMCLVLYL